MRYVEFMKKVVPLHDDLFDFFYEALPGYEHVGERRILLGCWGSLNDPDVLRLHATDHMTDWGTEDVRHPGRRSSTASWSPTTWSTSTSASGSCSATRTTRTGPSRGREVFVDPRPAGQPGRPSGTRGTSTRSPSRPSATSTTTYSWTMSPRWFDGTDHLALDTGGGPIARLWSTALSGLVDMRLRARRPGTACVINLPRTALKPEVTFEWKIPQWSNAIERNRARTYFQAYAAALALHFVREGARGGPGRPHRDLDAVRGAGRGRSASASPRRCAACSATTW